MVNIYHLSTLLNTAQCTKVSVAIHMRSKLMYLIFSVTGCRWVTVNGRGMCCASWQNVFPNTICTVACRQKMKDVRL